MSRRAKFFCASAGAFLLLSIWVARDLLIPVRHDLRDFDPHQVARLETWMWRSYYEHRSLALFAGLVQTLRTQYRLPFWRSCLGAVHAARAAVVFQKGTGRQEYTRALPDLESFYTLIRSASASPFDPRVAAQRELEWWIVHRERARLPAGELERSLAALQSGIFGLPAEAFAEHAAARAEAMVLRDSHAASITPADWQQIASLLDRSWSSLHHAGLRDKEVGSSAARRDSQ